MNKKISIIIVNYNSRDFLYNCLRSIQENITVDYEVIVVDNCSSDESVFKCREIFSDGRFILINSG